MFENLTPREKKLAMIIGGLLPLFIVATSFFWFMDKVQKNQSTIAGLESDIEIEETKLQVGMQAGQRRNYYREISLPSRIEETGSTYAAWLKRLVQDDIKMVYNGITPRPVGDLKSNGVRLGKRMTFTLRPEATYGQLVEFLHEFYSADQLHRINQLSIRPIMERAKEGQKAYTGRYKVTLVIEVLALSDADEQFSSFPRHRRELKKDLAGYQESILGRNIFGPANNAPQIEAQMTREYRPGKEIRFTLRGKDLDERDVLAFEILPSESDVKATFVGEQPSQAGKRAMGVTVGPLEVGTYKLKALVRDNGYPSKSSEKLFTIKVADPPKKPEKTIPPPKAPYKIANLTFIVGLMRAADGQREVMIQNRKDSETMELRVGEKFDLDELEWVLKSVDAPAKQVTFEVGGEVLTFKTGSSLSQPLSRTAVEGGEKKGDPFDESAGARKEVGVEPTAEGL